MGLPTIILPGYFAGAIPYQPLQEFLEQRGFPTVTVPLQRRDWLPTLGGRPVTPILHQLHRTLQGVLLAHGCDRVNLIGHSAGGWIARIYLGDQPYRIPGGAPEKEGCWRAYPQVATLLTLGTPHRSQERWTRRNLDFVNQTYPGAYYPQVRYVCGAGKAVFGDRRWGSWLAYSSYQMTGGMGACWGDGITPVEAAHLEGAENLTLEGVEHSPRRGGRWYGSPEVAEIWADYLA